MVNKKIVAVLFFGVSLSLIGMDDQDRLMEQALIPGSEKPLFARCVSKLFSSCNKKTGVLVCIGSLLSGMIVGTTLSAVNRTARMNVPRNDSSDSSDFPSCVTWNANGTINPCSWMEPATAWAIARCQLDQMTQHSDDSCVPVCFNTLKYMPEIKQKIPVGFDREEYYDSYGACSVSSPDLNDIDMYVLCPSRWARVLKNIFIRDNISHCDITPDNPAQQAFIIKAYETEKQEQFSHGMKEAVNVQAYMNLVQDTSPLLESGFCQPYAELARDILQCEGPLVERDDDEYAGQAF